MRTPTDNLGDVQPAQVPVLEPNDRLNREEFERRYHAMPRVKKAELLKGIVHMPSPVRMDQHAKPHALVVTWLGLYAAATPGVEPGDNATVRLGPESEPQPDALLRITSSTVGRSAVDPDDYITGPPELIVEIASSSASYDLHIKLDVYREHGVLEYLVWRVGDQDLDWLELRDGRYEPLAAGPDNVLRSHTFPGLWLDKSALLRGDAQQVMAVLQDGLTSPEHSAFVRRLAGPQ